MKPGKIIPNGVSLEKHEYNTILLLTNIGYDIELIPKSNIPGTKSPDIRIGKLLWEIKSPKGQGNSLIKNTIQKAVQQSENIIIDLRRTKRHQSKCLSEVKKEFHTSKKVKRLKIITKSQKILDFSK